MRLDKWLWAARCFKTRALAAEAADHGRVRVNDLPAKPGRELRVGDVVALRHDGLTRTLSVRALAMVRGPATTAQTLYEESAESLAAREQAVQARRVAAEAGAAPGRRGRPTKAERRAMDAAGRDWQRWSVSLDDH